MQRFAIALTLCAALSASARAQPADPEPDPGANEPAQEAPPPKVIDFGEEEAFGPGEVMTGRPEGDVEFGSLLRDRHRRLLEARDQDRPPRGSESRRRAGLALSAGVALSGLTGDLPGASARVGGAVGVAGSFTLVGVAIDPELWYVAKGATVAGADPLHGLTLPVLVGYRGVGRYRLSLGAGPAVGLALSSEHAGAPVARWELSAIVSGAARVPVGQAAIALGLRYEHGLTQLIPDTGSRSRVVMLTAGYAL